MEEINYALQDNEYLNQPSEPEETVETSEEVDVQETVGTENIPQTTPTQFEIEGIGNVTPEQIKEWKQGYMRQSDYTRKTQELARMRKEFNQPSTQNVPQQTQTQAPGFVQQIMQRMDAMEQENADRQVEYQINTLKQRYPDFDEVKVLNTALEKGITDLELVYKATREVNEAELRERLKQEIIAELAQTKNATKTIVTSEKTQQTNVTKLTPQETRIAKAMGMTAEEYAKWR